MKIFFAFAILIVILQVVYTKPAPAPGVEDVINDLRESAKKEADRVKEKVGNFLCTLPGHKCNEPTTQGPANSTQEPPKPEAVKAEKEKAPEVVAQ